MRQLRARAAFLAACLAANCAAAQGQDRQDFAPACASPNSRALDFWIGAWDVDWRMADGRSGRGASTVVLENGGCVIREHFRDLDGGVEGTGIYSYFAATGRWSQAWMDNQGVTIHATGGPPREGEHRFELNLVRGPDPNMRYRTVWGEVTPNEFVWRYQTRGSDDAAWTDQVVPHYRRKPGAGAAVR
jgi:hypothetical protein